MIFSVKNTTMRMILELFCPHYCLLCGRLGSAVCNECKFYNINDYNRMRVLIDGLKFRSIRSLAWPLAEILERKLPCLPKNVVVVPVPTISVHVRERGLDHTYLIAKNLAKLRGWRCVKLVRRITNTVQVGASAKLRQSQAEEAYELVGEVEGQQDYLVIDDVCTTGASLSAVRTVLEKGGAKKISVAVLARSGD